MGTILSILLYDYILLEKLYDLKELRNLSRSRTDPDTAIMYRKTEPAKTAMTAANRHRHSCFYGVSVQDPEEIHGPLDLFHQCVEHLGS